MIPQFTATPGHLSLSLQGFTVALVMLNGAATAIYGGQLADQFGVLLVVAVGAVFYVVGSVLKAAASRLAVFIVSRALTDLDLGP